MTTTHITTDVAIIGAGIVGSSAALHLAEHDIAVAVIERGDVSSEASGVNMGGLGGGDWHSPPTLDNYLRRGSVELFRTLACDIAPQFDMDIGFRLSGGIEAIQTEEELEFATRLVVSNPVRDSILLSTREARSIEPALNPRLAGALYLPNTRGHAEPLATTQAMAHAAQTSGAEVYTHTTLTEILRRAAGGFDLRVKSEHGDVANVTCERLLITAGCWANEIAQMLGLAVPIVPVRGQMWASAPLPPLIFQTIGAVEAPLAWSKDRAQPDVPPALTHGTAGRRTRHLYGRQNQRGEIIFGGDRELLGYDRNVSNEGIAANKTQATEIFPVLAEHAIKRTWSGLMPFSLDGKPVIGRLAADEPIFVAGGLASSGFGRGPMTGKLIADYIRTGAAHPVLSEADPMRFKR